MVMVAMAVAAVIDAPALNLDLICTGRYADAEVTRAQSLSGEGSALVTRTVMRDGTARVAIRGATGELTYPDGRKRPLSNVVADDRTITGEYKRMIWTWKMTIDRTTGDIRIVNGGDVSLLANCSAAPVTQKF
jgi:hypothetical protein